LHLEDTVYYVEDGVFHNTGLFYQTAKFDTSQGMVTLCVWKGQVWLNPCQAEATVCVWSGGEISIAGPDR